MLAFENIRNACLRVVNNALCWHFAIALYGAGGRLVASNNTPVWNIKYNKVRFWLRAELNKHCVLNYNKLSVTSLLLFVQKSKHIEYKSHDLAGLSHRESPKRAFRNFLLFYTFDVFFLLFTLVKYLWRVMKCYFLWCFQLNNLWSFLSYSSFLSYAKLFISSTSFSSVSSCILALVY